MPRNPSQRERALAAARAMPPAERIRVVRRAVREVGSQTALADLLAREPSTIARWLAGDVPVPTVVLLALRRVGLAAGTAAE